MVVFVYFTLLFVLVLKFGPFGVTAARPADAAVQTRQRALGDEVSTILNSIREGYDKRVRPNYGGEPVVVGVTMYVLSISSLSEVQMDFTVDFYFRQTWKDPRLKFKGPPGINTLSVGSEFLKTLWVPDTFFVNEKKSYFHTATTQNEFLRISQDGDVLRSIRLTVTASCPMDLRYFPMDRQLCTIEIESSHNPEMTVVTPSMISRKVSSFDYQMSAMVMKYAGAIAQNICCLLMQKTSTNNVRLSLKLSGIAVIVGYTMVDIEYQWAGGRKSIGMGPIQLPQFTVLGHRHTQTYILLSTVGYTMSDIRYKWAKGHESVGVSSDVSLPQFKVLGHRQQSMDISLTTGNYSRLACEIQFVRSMGYYLIQIYIPSGLIVIISWVSFWLNRNATPARVALGVTTVLTMTTLMSSTNAALPKISYVKSIDVYLGTCFVMVFASLLEYATVGYMAKRIQMRKNRFMALQKMAEQKKKEMEEQHNNEHHAKQTEVRFKVHDPKSYAKGAGTLENTVNGARGGDEENPAHPILPPGKDINKLYGITPSDIDKYSRVVFPVCFICFNLMYWIIYLHISDVVEDDLVLLEKTD